MEENKFWLYLGSWLWLSSAAARDFFLRNLSAQMVSSSIITYYREHQETTLHQKNYLTNKIVLWNKRERNF